MLNRSKILPLLLVLVFVFLVLPIYNVAAQVQKPSLIIEFGNWGGQEGEWANIEGKTAYCPPDLQAKGMECLSIPWIGQYVSALYQYSVGIAAILAMVMIMVGGFLWLTSAGSPDRVGKAKEFITSAIMGLALALFSFVILYTINPRLVNLGGVTVVVPFEQILTCCYQEGNVGTWRYISENSSCEKTLGAGYLKDELGALCKMSENVCQARLGIITPNEHACDEHCRQNNRYRDENNSESIDTSKYCCLCREQEGFPVLSDHPSCPSGSTRVSWPRSVGYDSMGVVNAVELHCPGSSWSWLIVPSTGGSNYVYQQTNWDGLCVTPTCSDRGINSIKSIYRLSNVQNY